MSEFQAASEYLPHRPPMRFIDSIAVCGEGQFRSRYTVPADSPFLREDGSLPPDFFVELMAQCFGAGASLAGNGVSLGYLASIKKARFFGLAFVGDCLEASCTVTALVGQIYVLTGAVAKNGDILAEAELKIFIPEKL